MSLALCYSLMRMPQCPLNKRKPILLAQIFDRTVSVSLMYDFEPHTIRISTYECQQPVQWYQNLALFLLALLQGYSTLSIVMQLLGMKCCRTLPPRLQPIQILFSNYSKQMSSIMSISQQLRYFCSPFGPHTHLLFHHRKFSGTTMIVFIESVASYTRCRHKISVSIFVCLGDFENLADMW